MMNFSMARMAVRGRQGLRAVGELGDRGKQLGQISRGGSTVNIAGKEGVERLTPKMARNEVFQMGKRRTMWTGAGVGAVGLASGSSGMKAKSSGGYTGA